MESRKAPIWYNLAALYKSRQCKKHLFGRDGFFYASLKDPDKDCLQSMSFSRFASKVISSVPSLGNKVGEDSVIDSIANITDMFN